jgi:uncharacterized protein (DUF427 family)
MGLTVGTGPFGHQPTSRFDVDPPSSATFVEVRRRRVRAVKDGKTVVDSNRAQARLPHRQPAVLRLEEEERVIVHPRDPYHRIDVHSSSREVRFHVAGEDVTRSTARRILFETGLPPRYYLAPEDLGRRRSHPEPASSPAARTRATRYFDARHAEAIAWTYPEPLHEAGRVRDRICFFQERREVELPSTERSSRRRRPSGRRRTGSSGTSCA